MEQTQYRKTGNVHHIPLPEMIDHVILKINQFNEIKEATGGTPPQNPFTDALVFTTNDGRTVQIPEQVQKQAIEHYNKSINGPVEEKQEEEVEEQEPKVVVVESDNSILWFAIIIIGLILLYFIYKQGKLN
jgi:hypothetical protein